MDGIIALSLIAFAGLIHASFQLSVSVLTLLSGHAIGKKTAHARLMRLTTGYVIGVGVMTLLLLSSLIHGIEQSLNGAPIPAALWAGSAGLLIGLGVAVWVFYYRREPGTSLWLPRGLARYLSDRSKATRRSAEAFGLGLVSIVTELVFIIAPLLLASLVLVELAPLWQLGGIALYVVLSLLPLLIVWGLIGGGHRLSRIQHWRERNKRFLQVVGGGGLLVLGFYVYVEHVIAPAAYAAERVLW